MSNYTVRIKSSCNAKDRIGGWSAVINNKLLSGGKSDTTVHRMELTALIEAVKTINNSEKNLVQIVCKSDYIHKAMANFRDYQKISAEKGLRGTGKIITRGGQPLANLDLWNELISEAKKRNVYFIH